MVPTTKVCRAAGCTYRQIDYWCRAGVLHPTTHANGSGSRRSFDHKQVRVVALVARLAALGATVPVLAEAAWGAEGLPDDAWDGQALIDRTGRIYRDPRVLLTGWAVDLGQCAEAELQLFLDAVLAAA